MLESESLYDIVDKLSYPLLVLEEIKEKEFSIVYKNSIVESFLSSSSEEDSGEEFDDSEILELLGRYQNESKEDTFTLNNIKIFSSIYNIHFDRVQNRIVMIFIEVDTGNIFKNMSFHDLRGVCSALLIVLNDKGKIVDANGCFSDLVGMQNSEVIGKSLFENFIPGNLETLNYHLNEIISNEIYNQQFVTPLKSTEGTIYKINWQVSKITMFDKLYIVVVGSNISKIFEENNELKKTLNTIKIGFDYFPMAIAYMNSAGRLTKMNPRFMKMFRLEDNSLLFDEIALFKKHIGFKRMSKEIESLKEVNYVIDYGSLKKKLKIDIRLLKGKKDSSKFYIIVAQQI